MRAAVIQMVSGKDVDQNLDRADQLLTSLQNKNIDLVVLPEMFACLGVKNQVELAQSRFHDQDVVQTIGEWANKLNCYLIAGSIPLASAECNKVAAACLVFDPLGNLQTRYDKIHLFDVDVADCKGSYRESDTFSAGHSPQVAQIGQHKLGLSICYDVRFPELYQYYAQQGCEIITVPSAFTYKTGQAHWETLLRARAIETQSFVLAANQGGVHEDGRETWGQSVIIAPSGEILAQVDEAGEGVAVAELDFSLLQAIRRAMPIQQHKRLGLPK